MPITGGAIIGGSSLIGGGLGLYSGKQQAKAMNRQGAAQLQASREAIAAQERGAAKAAEAFLTENEAARNFLREQTALAQEQLQPFTDVQLQALRESQNLLNVDSPYYDRLRSEGTNQITRRLAAQGLLNSGRQAALATNLELGLLSDVTNRNFDRQAALANLGALQAQAQMTSNLGQGLAGLQSQLGAQLGQTYGNLGSNIGSTIMGGQQAASPFFVGAAQAQGQGLAAFNNALQGAGQNLMLWNMMSGLGGSNTPSSGQYVGTVSPNRYSLM